MVCKILQCVKISSIGEVLHLNPSTLVERGVDLGN